MGEIIKILKTRIKKNKMMNNLSRSIYCKLPFEFKLWFSRISENSYQELEDKNKVIFIHIPKAAGNSITKALFNKESTGHYFLQKYKKDNIEKFNRYFKFTITRNPWDKILSAFFYLKQGGFGVYDRQFSKKFLSDCNSFEEFILKLKDKSYRERILKWTHFIPQYKFLCNKQGEIEVDYIGKIETIEKDFKYLKKRFNKPNAVLKKYNKSTHRKYYNYYNREMVEVVRDIYKRDIDLLKYEFPYEK